MLFTVNESPELKELQSLIIPNYATCWKEIGIGLSLSYEALQIIEIDFERTTQRCTNMLAKWLQTDVNATWQTLLQVIDSPAVSNSLPPALPISHDESKYIILLRMHGFSCMCVLISCPHIKSHCYKSINGIYTLVYFITALNFRS